MRRTSDSAHEAVEAVRPDPMSPDDYVWIDELLVRWLGLNPGRSAIARALEKVWSGGRMPEQIRRAIGGDANYGRPSRVGVRLTALVEAADAAAGNAEEIREQDLVAGLLAVAQRAVQAAGIDPDRFLDSVRSIEGVGAAARVADARGVDETTGLANEVARRIESGEPLSGVLPLARRLAEMRHRVAESSWLGFEMTGWRPPASKRAVSEAERQGALIYAGLHRTYDANAIDFTDHAAILRRRPERTMVDDSSVSQLERSSEPAQLSPTARQDPEMLRSFGILTVRHSEAAHILDQVRTAVHRFATESLSHLRRERRMLEVFGPESFAVFDVGGERLSQLAVALDDLDKPGGYPTAALASRTALLTLGRELYRGPDTFTSPRTGETFPTNRAHEKNRLRARLHELWHRADPGVRQLIEAAEVAMDETHALGSRAKDPSAITYGQALQCLRGTFAVARALMLSGGLAGAGGNEGGRA